MITFLLVAILFTILLGYPWFRQPLGWFFIAVLLLLAYAHETAQREQPTMDHMPSVKDSSGVKLIGKNGGEPGVAPVGGPALPRNDQQRISGGSGGGHLLDHCAQFRRKLAIDLLRLPVDCHVTSLCSAKEAARPQVH
jgi:hypothetical protein